MATTYTEKEIRTCTSLLQEPHPDYCYFGGLCGHLHPHAPRLLQKDLGARRSACRVPDGEMEKIELRKQGFDV